MRFCHTFAPATASIKWFACLKVRDIVCHCWFCLSMTARARACVCVLCGFACCDSIGGFSHDNFVDADVTHVDGTVDPIRDIHTIAGELRAKDLQFMETAVAAMEKTVRQIDKSKKGELDALLKVQQWLKVRARKNETLWRVRGRFVACAMCDIGLCLTHSTGRQGRA